MPQPEGEALGSPNVRQGSSAERPHLGFAFVVDIRQGGDCPCLVEPHPRVELLAKHRLAIVAPALRLRAVDYAYEPLQPLLECKGRRFAPIEEKSRPAAGRAKRSVGV